MVTDVMRVVVLVVLVMVGAIWRELRHIRHRAEAEAEALHILAENTTRPD
jgi:hypothetical protein